MRARFLVLLGFATIGWLAFARLMNQTGSLDAHQPAINAVSAVGLGLVAMALALLDYWGAVEWRRDTAALDTGLRRFVPGIVTTCALGWTVPPVYMLSVFFCWGNDNDIGQGGIGIGLVWSFVWGSWLSAFLFGAAWLALWGVLSVIDKHRSGTARAA